MKDLKTICDKIQSTNSIKEKQKILIEYKDNTTFKSMLQFLLDDRIVTGISKKKIEKQFNNANTDDFKQWVYDINNLFTYLKEHNTGTDQDIMYCQMFLVYDNDLNDFVKSIITKSLKLGIDTKTVNKVYGKTFIPVWEVQLGSGFDKLKLKQDEYFFLSRKLNGNRCSYIDGRLISRQGKEFTGLNHIIEDINKLDLQDFFIDGELIRKNIDNVSDGENFRIGTGIISSDSTDKTEIKFVIFDMFSSCQLCNKESKMCYSDRKKLLNNIRKQINNFNLKNIDVVEMVYEGTDTTQIDKWLNYAVEHDWEGCMLNKDTTYKCKRTTDLIKIKRFYTMDLPIIDFEEGDGRNKGTLGAFIVDFKGNKVNVGSGFTDSQRKEFWDNRYSLIGRIIEVKYKEISKSKDTGLESLQFPVFVGLREVGKEISYE